LYEVVAECRLCVLMDADAALTEERAAEVFGTMLHAGVEEYFGVLREVAIAVKSSVVLSDTWVDE
jgi:hypothetical protein